jgi:hypothetical protein
MRIGTVSTIVGAHEARNAASRLTMPVSDGKRPIFSVAASRRAASQRSQRTLRRTPLGGEKKS